MRSSLVRAASIGCQAAADYVGGKTYARDICLEGIMSSSLLTYVGSFGKIHLDILINI